MKTRTLMVALVAVLGLALIAGAAEKADKPKKERPKGKRITLVGTVSTTTDDAGAINGIVLTLKDGTIIGLAMDDNSNKMVAEMAGKEVRVMGMVSQVQVTGYKDAADEPAKGEKPAKAPKKPKKAKKTDDMGGGDAPAGGNDDMGGGDEN